MNRTGDVALRCWLRVRVSTVQAQTNTRIRWTTNFGHNLIREISIQFTGLPAQVFDNYFLDQWAASQSPLENTMVTKI